MPGGCLDPIADVKQRLARQGEGEIAIDASPDLDGDGRRMSRCRSGSGRTRCSTSRAAAAVTSSAMSVDRRRSRRSGRGLADLVVPEVSACEGARCGCEPGEHHFVFDGTAYELDKSRTKEGTEKPCAG